MNNILRSHATRRDRRVGIMGLGGEEDSKYILGAQTELVVTAESLPIQLTLIFSEKGL